MKLLQIIIILLFSLNCFGQDICSNATPINCGDIVNGNTSLFTPDVVPFCGTGDGTGGGLWYSIVGTGGNITASLCGSTYDTKLRVFSGNCGALVCTGGNDDFCGLQSEVTWSSVLGTTYYILVHGFGSSQGAYTLTMTCVAPPAPASLCYTVSQIGYNPIAPGGTSVTMTDDAVTGALPIGFTFCFGGVNYTNFYIGSNGWVGFTGGQPTTYTSVAIPNTGAGVPKNCIAGPWQDWHPGVAGGPYITYQTLGIAPNRTLVVTWNNCPFFSCTTVTGSFQIVLYETSNLIDNTLRNKPACLTWAGGTAVQGLHDLTGTLAVTVPGRNSTQWTATNETWRYTPNCAPCVVILPVELLEFNGYNKNDVNILRWSTATEINNDYFTLERSVDGLNWLTIEQVNGSGNSSVEVSYEYIDGTYPNEINYYRLTQTDFNGKSETFNIIGIVNLKVNETSDYTIVNLMGQEVSDDFTGIRIIIWENGERELLPIGSKNPKRK